MYSSQIIIFFLTTRELNSDSWIFPTKDQSTFEFGWGFEFK